MAIQATIRRTSTNQNRTIKFLPLEVKLNSCSTSVRILILIFFILVINLKSISASDSDTSSDTSNSAKRTFLPRYPNRRVKYISQNSQCSPWKIRCNYSCNNTLQEFKRNRNPYTELNNNAHRFLSEAEIIELCCVVTKWRCLVPKMRLLLKTSLISASNISSTETENLPVTVSPVLVLPPTTDATDFENSTAEHTDTNYTLSFRSINFGNKRKDVVLNGLGAKPVKNEGIITRKPVTAGPVPQPVPPLQSVAKATVFAYNNFAGPLETFDIFKKCITLPRDWQNRISSMNTHGTCIEICQYKNCAGRCLRVAPGTLGHNRLRDVNFDKRITEMRACSE